MKESFDDILKRKWKERQFPVDETHRGDMAELLKGNTRRRILPFWLGTLVIVLGVLGYFLLEKSDATPAEQIQPTTDSTEMITEFSEESASALENNSTGVISSPIAASGINPGTADKENPDPAKAGSKIIFPKKSVSVERDDPDTPKTPVVHNHKPDTPLKNIKDADKDVNPSIILERNTFLLADEKISDPENEPTGIMDERENPGTKGVGEVIISSTTDQRVSEVFLSMDALEMEGIIYSTGSGMDQIEPYFSKRKALYFFGEAGAGWVLASQPDFASGWKLKAGGGFGYRLESRFQLIWTSGYLMQHGGFDFERSSTVEQLGFGLRSSFNRLAPEKLHFIYSKMGTQYRLRRHILSAQGGIQWLYGAQGNITVLTHDQINVATTESTRYAWLKTHGLRRWHMTGDVSYGFQFTPRMRFNAGTDIYFSSFVIEDPDLTREGYYWNGRLAKFHPFITLNYMIYENR